LDRKGFDAEICEPLLNGNCGGFQGLVAKNRGKG